MAWLPTMASPVQQAPEKKWYTYTLATAAVLLNLPYMVKLATAEERKPLALLWGYPGSTQETIINHGLNVVSAACLWPDLSIGQNLAVNATLIGIQSCTYLFFPSAHGVSLIWSGLTGVMIGRLLAPTPCTKLRLMVPIVLNSIACLYYAFQAPMLTTGAHLGGMTAGFLLSIPLFNLFKQAKN